MFKLPLILVLLCVGNSRCSATDSVSTDIQIVFKAIAEMFQAVGKFFAAVGEAIKEVVQKLTSEVGIAAWMRLAMVIMDSGISIDEMPQNLYQRYYTVTSIVMKMTRKLNTMEKTFEVLNDATVETANYTLENTPKDVTPVFKYLFTKAIESRIARDPELHAVYQSIESSLPSSVKYVSLKEAQRNEALMEKIGVNILEFMLRKMHVQHSTINILTTFKKEHYVVARSVLELAKKPGNLDTVQEMYDKSMAEMIDLWNQPMVEMSVILNSASILYDKIDKKILQSPLKAQYEVTKKEVANSSKWNTGLLNVNVLPF